MNHCLSCPNPAATFDRSSSHEAAGHFNHPEPMPVLNAGVVLVVVGHVNPLENFLVLCSTKKFFAWGCTLCHVAPALCLLWQKCDRMACRRALFER
eukprot:3494816-Amphidinium_carterae.1